ncbi:uncharacterized protein [Apostichopus japonicus]|uniref:uncharacterized protein isoform X3 n=1 Tax=Stichopus japonicus TaxID=307972 RepID=UPI003AB79677
MVTMTSPKSKREAPTYELETLNLLQVEMEKRATELQHIRLGLFPSAEELPKGNMDRRSITEPHQDIVIPGIPENRLKSAVERIKSREQETQNQSNSNSSMESKSNISSGSLAATNYHDNTVMISSGDNFREKTSTHRDVMINKPTNRYFPFDEARSVSIRQSGSFPNLDEWKEHDRSLMSFRSLPGISNPTQDFIPSSSDQLEEEAAAGRVLLDSLANENKLEERLTLSELQVKALKTEIGQLKENHMKKEDKHQGTIQVLLQRIDEVSKRKQREINAREEENKAKEEIISKLSKTLQNAEKAMEMLEKTLESTKQELVKERRRSSSQKEALLQVYETVELGTSETDKTKDDGEAENISVTPHAISERVRGYVEGREKQTLELIEEREDAEERCRKLQEEIDESIISLRSEHKQRIAQLQEDRDTELKAANERAVNSRQQTLGLQSQLRMVEEHSQLEIKAKVKQNSELLAKIQEQREKIEKLTSDRETEDKKYRDLIDKSHDELEARNIEISNLKEKHKSLQEELNIIQETFEDVSKDLSEANTEKARLNKLQDDQKEELASCQKKLQEELEDVSQLKEKLKQQEDCYNMKLTQEINALQHKTVSEIEDSKTECKEKVRILTEELTRIEENAQKKKRELKKAKDFSRCQLNRVKELESKVETFRQTKSDLSVLLENKEGDLLKLQHERDILENLYEKSQKDAQLELKEKSKIENTLMEIEPRYRELLMENQKLLSVIDQLEGQQTTFESERHQLLDKIKEADVELEKKTNLNRVMNEKLEGLEERSKQLEQNLKETETVSIKTEESSKRKTTEMKKLLVEKKKLEEVVKEARNKVWELEKERTYLADKSTEHKMKFEKERRVLRCEIKILQSELRLVRGTIQANNAMQEGEEEGIKETADIKKNAALQRGLVESLQGEINWLEERLQITQETVRSQEGKAKIWEEIKKKFQNRIEKLEKERKELIQRRKDQKSLVLKLESGLEKASLRFAESQQQMEKQAQELARMRLQHQLELKELKGTLLNQLTNNVILTKVANYSKDVASSHGNADKPAVGGCNQRLKTMSDADLKLLMKGLMKLMRKEMEAEYPKTVKDEEEGNNNRSFESLNKTNLSGSLVEELSLQLSAGDTKATPICNWNKFSQVDESKKFSTPASTLYKPETPSAILDSPVSTLLSRRCLPEDTPENATYLDSKPQLNVPGRNEESKDHNKRQLSQGHTRNIEMKGFVDKLDKLTTIGNQLLDENKEMEMLLEEEEEEEEEER